MNKLKVANIVKLERSDDIQWQSLEEFKYHKEPLFENYINLLAAK